MRFKLVINRYFNSILFAIGIAVVFIFFSNGNIETKYFLSLIGSIIALYIGVTRYQLNNDKIFLELFNHFNEKYDNKFNNFFNSLENGEKNAEELDRNLVIDYLNFCAEEYLWYKKGRIPNDVWTSWEAGILTNLNRNEIREIVNDEKEYEDTYYGLYRGIGWEKEMKHNKLNS